MSGVARGAVTLALTVAAGAVGAALRAVVAERAPRVGIHAVNVAGTVVLALIVRAVDRGTLGAAAAVILGVGFAGALTTFSGWVGLVVERTRTVGRVRAAAVDVVAPTALATVLTIAMFASG